MKLLRKLWHEILEGYRQWWTGGYSLVSDIYGSVTIGDKFAGSDGLTYEIVWKGKIDMKTGIQKVRLRKVKIGGLYT